MSALPPSLRLSNVARSIEARVPFKALRDLSNRLRYGPKAPLSDELIFVDPSQITHRYLPNKGSKTGMLRRAQSGLVLSGSWDRDIAPIETGIKYRACIAHFVDGVPWQDTGLFEDMLSKIAKQGHADGCRSLADLEARYAALDAIFEQTAKLGRFKSRKELGAQYFRREHGGVLVHITRDGSVIRAGGGQHRFAMAHALGLTEMPAQLGVIHSEAFKAGVLTHLRRSKLGAPS